MTTYWLTIGIAVLAGSLLLIFLVALVFGDPINDRNRSREAQAMNLPEIHLTPADRDLVRLREAA